MLEFIRSRAQTWISWVIVGLIVIPFALWGMNEYFSGSADNNVATVNGKKISERDFQMAFAQQRQRMKEMMGESFDFTTFEAQMRKGVLDSLVEQEVLVQTAGDEGMRIGDQQLAMIIQSFPAFQKDGQFDKQAYATTLQIQGQTPAYFEMQMRRGLLAQQVYSGVADTSLVTDWDVKNLLRLRRQEREISYAQIPAALFKSDISADAAAIQSYYDANQARFMTPETVSIEYIDLAVANIAREVNVSEATVKGVYEEQRQQYAEPEERRASHILIEVQADASADARAAAREKAEGILKRIISGEAFDKLAREFSDDPGSAEEGGDLGFFRKGVMVPEFDTAVFSMKPGDTSGLVKSEFGFHIIRLMEVKGGRIPSFAELKDELLQQYREREAERIFFERQETLANLSYEHPDTLVTVAEAIGAEVKTIPMFTRDGGPGIASNPKVLAAAFTEEAIKQGLNSDVIEIGDNHVAVIRVKEHVKQKQKPLEEVRAQIEQELIQQGTRQRATALGKEIQASLQGGGTAEDVLSKYRITWQNVGLVTREYRQADPGIVQEAFRLNRPEQDKAVYGGAVLGNGDYAVIRLTSVKEPDMESFAAEDKMAMKRTLQNILGNAEYAEFSGNLKKQASIVVKLKE